MNANYWLMNTRLETGFQVNKDIVTATNTKTSNLLIDNGKIKKIITSSDEVTDDLPRIDAKGTLALPSFIEKHCHLDKTLLEDEWRAGTPVNTIFERFEMEKEVLSSLDTSTQERAKSLLDRYVDFGITHVRTHVDIYPEVGLKNLEDVKEVSERYDDKLTSEIVAFPQHGLLRSDSKELVRQALRNGASLIGGVDPATVDGDLEASLNAMVTLAVEEDAGIDLHLHDPSHLGIFTIKRLAELTIKAGLQGKVTISHAYGLGDISVNEAEEIADLLEKAGVAIISSVPINRQFPPMGLLKEKGVSTAIGCDNIFDVWSPFGNGDILERAGRLAEASGWVDERALAQTLSYITGGKTPLSYEGEKLWPKAGDEANIVLVNASCSADAVARRAERVATIFKGKMTQNTSIH